MNELTSRYAQALYMLKKEKNTLLESQQEVKELTRIIKDNDAFLILLDSHQLPLEERLQMVDKTLYSIDPDIKNFIKIIIENNRALYLLDIFNDFNSLVNEYRGVKEGLLYSAFPLKEEEVDKITSAISKIEGQTIELKNIVDPTLIGGVRVAINDHVYDGSLKHHIEQMKLTLLKKEGEDDEN